jgi:acetate kinase
MHAYHMDAAAIEHLIYRQSGLLGVSGISSDMRTLRASSDAAAREAIALFSLVAGASGCFGRSSDDHAKKQSQDLRERQHQE